MSISEFLRACEASFGNGKVRLMPGQEAAYFEKLSQFDGQQIAAIYGKVLELAEHFPRVKHIYDAARELGYLQTIHDDFRPHRWEETECNLCRGEGRICVTWQLSYEAKNESYREVHVLKQIVPYAASCDSRNFKTEKDEFRSIFRCKCLAGESETLPRSWPKFGSHIEPVRYA